MPLSLLLLQQGRVKKTLGRPGLILCLSLLYLQNHLRDILGGGPMTVLGGYFYRLEAHQ